MCFVRLLGGKGATIDCTCVYVVYGQSQRALQAAHACQAPGAGMGPFTRVKHVCSDCTRAQRGEQCDCFRQPSDTPLVTSKRLSWPLSSLLQRAISRPLLVTAPWDVSLGDASKLLVEHKRNKKIKRHALAPADEQPARCVHPQDARDAASGAVTWPPASGSVLVDDVSSTSRCNSGAAVVD